MGQEAFGFSNCAAFATQTIRDLPDPGQVIGGNLWNLNLRPNALEQAGQLEEFTKHTTTGMFSPNVLRHVRTDRHIDGNLSHLLASPSRSPREECQVMWSHHVVFCTLSQKHHEPMGPENREQAADLPGMYTKMSPTSLQAQMLQRFQ